MNRRKLYCASSGLFGALILMGCSGGDSGSGLTLPIVNSVPESSVVQESTTTLPIFSDLYTIQSGDTLSKIAQIFGVSVDDLISFNAISNPDAIEAGQVLKVPEPVNPIVNNPPESSTLAP